MPPEQRPFRFGVFLPGSAGSRDEVLEIAKRAEDAGASVLLATDHLGGWAPLTRLVAAAQATSLRIGTLVLNNELRHPAVLAQELATVDAMTDGRLEVGIGAGWNREEMEAGGIAFAPAGDRVRRMRASFRMLRQALEHGRIDHEPDDAYPAIQQSGLPTSVQRPHPPFMVGGGGPKVLGFAARNAEIVGIDRRALPGGGGDPDDATAAAVDRKVSVIRDAAGERWADLELSIIVWDVYPDFRPGDAAPRGAVERGTSAEELPESPHFLVGDAERMAESLLARRERWGISYITIPASGLAACAPLITRLAQE